MTNKVSFIYIGQDRFSKLAKSINRTVDKQKVKFRNLRKEVKKTGLAFKKMSGSMISGFKGMALAALAFFSIRGFISKGAQFQESLADLSAITGATGADLDKLKNSAFELSKTMATSGHKVLTAFKLVASAKPDLLKNLDALTATTDQVLLLKNAAGIELADAANITAQSLNIFGKNADQASKFVNILAAGSKLGGSVVADTGAAIIAAGLSARSAGLDFGSLNAAIQTVALNGVKGAQAGTALNAIFTRLRVGGIDIEKLGLEKTFELIGKEIDSVTDNTARANLQTEIFGLEHAKVGLGLVNNFRQLGRFEKSLRNTKIAEEQAAVNLVTFNAKLRKLGATFDAVLIKVFLKLEPAITKNIEKLSAFFDTISDKQIDAMVESLKGLVNAMGVLLDVAIQIVAAFDHISNAVKFAMPTAVSSLGKLADVYSLGASFFGTDDSKDTVAKTTGDLSSGAKNQTDVNVNLRAPERTIESIKSRTSGKSSGLNVGVNMAVAQ